MTSEHESKLIEIFGQAIGHASVCWIPDTGSAVFDSTQAKMIVDDLINRVKPLIDALEYIYENDRGDHDPIFGPIIYHNGKKAKSALQKFYREGDQNE